MSLSIHTAEVLSKLPFLEEVDFLKKEVDSYKPLPKETEERILQKFRLDWNYHSNAIEGNKLTYGETVAFLMEGITAKAKPLKDHLDIKGHDEAIKYLLALVKDKQYLLTESEIRNLHRLILKEPYWSEAVTPEGLKTRKEIKIGQYKSSSNHVITPTGETHYYASPEQTPILMGELMEWYRDAKSNNSIHPIILAALFHHQFTSIHPFDDGNGRIARLLMNLMLMRQGFPPIVIKEEDRLTYYQVLRQADANEMIPFTEYINELMRHSLNIYLKGAKGESIEEKDDVDKEITLFKKGLEQTQLFELKSKKSTRRILIDTIIPLLTRLRIKLKEFDDLFLKTLEQINITRTNENSQNEIFYTNIDEFIKHHPKTHIYLMDSFRYVYEMIGFKKSSKYFDEKFNFSLTCYDSYVYIITSSGKTYELKYHENLSEEQQKEIISESIRYLLESLKKKTNEK